MNRDSPRTPQKFPCGGATILMVAGFMAATGCASYQSKPLDSSAIDAALAPPKPEAVRIAAEKFKHPLLAPMVIDGRDGFSPDEIALMVVIVSPQLRALRDQRGVAEAQIVQAGILPNPQLGYALDRPTAHNEPGLVAGRNLGLSWEITSLLGRQDRVAVARSGAAAFDLSLAWQEWQAAQDARLRAFRILSLRARLPLLRAIESDLAATLDSQRKAMALGQETIGDVTAASEAWLATQAARLAAEQDYQSELAALNLSLGQPADAEIALKPAVSFPELPPETSAAPLLQGLEQRRLDLAALALGYESGEAGLRAAIKAQFPKIGLSFAKVNDTSDVRTHTYGVTVDLPLFDRNQGNIAIARATRQQLFDEYVARVAEARSDVVLILGKIAGVRLQLAADVSALPALQQQVTAYEKALETKNASAPAYREARALFTTRKLDELTVRQQMIELDVALEIATGRPLLDRAESRSSSP
ncbi:MAG TPA: TolC family protein [Lacunisphaera sp.]|jgi:outer membrane protein TolC